MEIVKFYAEILFYRFIIINTFLSSIFLSFRTTRILKCLKLENLSSVFHFMGNFLLFRFGIKRCFKFEYYMKYSILLFFIVFFCFFWNLNLRLKGWNENLNGKFFGKTFYERYCAIGKMFWGRKVDCLHKRCRNYNMKICRNRMLRTGSAIFPGDVSRGKIEKSMQNTIQWGA